VKVEKWEYSTESGEVSDHPLCVFVCGLLCGPATVCGPAVWCVLCGVWCVL
jgi:hypothetical protein